MFLQRKNGKLLIVALIIVSVTLFCNIASANSFTDNVSSVFGFINKNIIGQIKKDFCKNYILSISNGDWKEGEFRTNIGKRVCTSYVVTTSSVANTPEALQPFNGNISIQQSGIPGASLINNSGSNIYVPNQSISGANLNADLIISLTNSERKKNDSSLVNLKKNSILVNIAAIRVKDMFARQYFEHNSPVGDNASKEADKNGYSYITIGENIALGNFDGSQGILTAWMNSPGHRANILNKNYTEIGVYVEQGIYNGQKVWIAAQIFGKPLSGCVQADENLKNNITRYETSADSLLTSINNIDAELKTLANSDVQSYNSKVAERNTLAGLYNNLASEIKNLVAEYNNEVATFNLCIKTI